MPLYTFCEVKLNMVVMKPVRAPWSRASHRDVHLPPVSLEWPAGESVAPVLMLREAGQDDGPVVIVEPFGKEKAPG